jgi:DhnA family fructose-bisphosphate aldolase class Ia
MQEITNKLVEGNADAILVHKGIAKRIDTGNAA